MAAPTMIIKAVKQLIFYVIGAVAFVCALISTMKFVKFCSTQKLRRLVIVHPSLNQSSTASTTAAAGLDGGYPADSSTTDDKLIGKEVWDEILLSLLKDFLLLLMFALQHSLMATRCFKSIVYRYFSLIVIERSVYVFITSLTLSVVLDRWESINIFLWNLDTSKSLLWWTLFSLVHLFLWMILFGQLCLMDLPELLGLKQIYFYSLGNVLPIKLKTWDLQIFYRHMRHPGLTCLTLILCVHPVMSIDRWLFATALAFYNFAAFRVTPDDYVYIDEQVERKEYELQRMRTKRRMMVTSQVK
ncbi:nurim homolog [Tubulanus polymorphus]|uniref:nurim homolog n=1 Tax=Tubulanus polymorphus TaxID=672921 RepID=UPI003DA4BB20